MFLGCPRPARGSKQFTFHVMFLLIPTPLAFVVFFTNTQSHPHASVLAVGNLSCVALQSSHYLLKARSESHQSTHLEARASSGMK